MELYYAPIEQDLTVLLGNKAQELAQKGYRVFYIAPNSLSFEKERKVLSQLPGQASLKITVTRFAQMARYFTLNHQNKATMIDERGLSMVFYRVLTQLQENDLTLYRQVRKDSAFIEQLVDLYKELQTANLSIDDLQGMSEDKLADLRLIFNSVDADMADLSLTANSQLSLFIEAIRSGDLQSQLSQTVVVIDGFTRFTGLEKELVSELNKTCHQVMIGVYASQRATGAYRLGNLYQASLDFLDDLQGEFATKAPKELTGNKPPSNFSRLTELVERHYDYSPDLFGTSSYSGEIVGRVQFWERRTVQEELEAVAKAIRGKLEAGYRYKDILVLLGNVDAYKLELPNIFDKYQIPYYLGASESMADHPLVHVIDSLERLKRYNFRTEDLLNLLKSGLYGRFSQSAIDYFDSYLTFAELRGQQQFSRKFTKGKKKFDLNSLNETRQELMSPLLAFFDLDEQTTDSLLDQFLLFIETSSLRENLYHLASFTDSQEEADRHEQVWKQFIQLLEQMAQIFAGHKMTVQDFLSLLKSGMMSLNYRLVPATVDVVAVKSYELIEPHTNQLVFALGLSQSNFPKVTQNTSLISDEERLAINERLGDQGQLELPSQDNVKQNHYVLLSLLNAAKQELTLSSLVDVNEANNDRSNYIATLLDLSLRQFLRDLGYNQSEQQLNLSAYDAYPGLEVLLSLTYGHRLSKAIQRQELTETLLADLQRKKVGDLAAELLMIDADKQKRLDRQSMVDGKFSSLALPLGTYYSVVSHLAERYQAGEQEKLTDEDQQRSYWLSLLRVLNEKLNSEDLKYVSERLFLTQNQSENRPNEHLETVSLSPETLSALYPVGQELSLSASALRDYYNNPYLYFIRYVLRLQEVESILPDARQHGEFLHKVLEYFVKDQSDTPLETKLQASIKQTLEDAEVATIYNENAQTRFSRLLLENHLLTTAALLERQDFTDSEQEWGFGFADDQKFLLDSGLGRPINVKGKIDRLDVMDKSYGVADYKSSDNKFDLADFYNRLSPQLLTYLSALKHIKGDDVFGAFYLQVQNPIMSLSKFQTSDDLLKEANKALVYKGLSVSGNSLPPIFSGMTFTKEDLDILLKYNDYLYQQAAQDILKGNFKIEPYSRDGKSVAGDQLKAITRFEADLHLGQARQLHRFKTNPRNKDHAEEILTAMKKDLGLPIVEEKGED